MKKLAFLILPFLFYPTLSHAKSIQLCSFNIYFLGQSTVRYNKSLAEILKDCDLAIIQELVAPPTDGNYPNGDPYTKNEASSAFFSEMAALGFEYSLSKEDTGPGEKNHKSTSSTEWSVIFFQDSLKVAEDLPNRFIGKDLSGHKIYRRVPHAHSFRTKNGKLDFVIINVHLFPDKNGDRKEERKKELKAIAKWVNNNDTVEKDFLIVGDMNINNKKELDNLKLKGWESLNDELDKTNTAKVNKPYDHVMYRPEWTTEMDTDYDQVEYPLAINMESKWRESNPYPGDPYKHHKFKKYFSDHVPIFFKMKIPTVDDD